jgi:hypothetical protein
MMGPLDPKETTVATTPSDTPGWRPDPEKPGMVRWWNGLGWSDARRSADATIERVRAQVTDAQRGSTITSSQVGRLNGDRSTLGAAASAAATGRAVAATNPFASAAVGVGILGLLFGLYGLLPLAGLLVSFAGLVRSRRLARDGARRTGLGQSLAGLAVSVAGLLRWIPVAVSLLPTEFQDALVR